MSVNATGKCLCGAVELEARTAQESIGACHCTMCRSWGGGPLLAVECGSDVSFKGEDNIQIYNSSDWAERAFCNKCGTHLFYRLKEPRQYHIPVGLFGDSLKPSFDMQIFIDSKPDYYSFANETKTLTGQQLFEIYAPKK